MVLLNVMRGEREVIDDRRNKGGLCAFVHGYISDIDVGKAGSEAPF